MGITSYLVDLLNTGSKMAIASYPNGSFTKKISNGTTNSSDGFFYLGAEVYPPNIWSGKMGGSGMNSPANRVEFSEWRITRALTGLLPGRSEDGLGMYSLTKRLVEFFLFWEKWWKIH